MRKLIFSLVVLLIGNASCGKLNPPISVSGRINCPSRNLTKVNPADYIIFLTDSLDRGKPNAGRETQPTAEGKYIFENLEAGHTYFLNVVNETPKFGNKLTLSSKALENALLKNQIPPKIGLAFLAADVNADGFVDARDLIALQDYISGKTSSLEAGFWRMVRISDVNESNNFVQTKSADPLSKIKQSVTNFDFIQVQMGDVDLTFCK
jgi:hypothetical protein